MRPYAELEDLISHILQGEGLDLLDRLSPEEKVVAWTVLQQLREGGTYRWLDELWSLDYDRYPPTIEEFLSDPEYLKPCGDDLYPKWKNELNLMLDPSNSIHEIVMRGCLAGDTKIPLLEGKTLTIKQIVDDFNAGIKNREVLSFNTDRKC